MKTFQKLSYLIAMASLIALASCGDDDSDPVKSDAEIIGSGIPWKFSAATANGISVISLIEECHLDNLITFNYQTPTSTGVVDSGPTKCDDSQPQTVDFTWSYNESTKVLTVDTDLIEVPGAEGNLIVERVTPTELVLSQTISFSGISQEVLVTLVH